MSSDQPGMQLPTQKSPNTINPQDKRDIQPYSVEQLLSIKIPDFEARTAIEKQWILEELAHAALSENRNGNHLNEIKIKDKITCLGTLDFGNLSRLGKEIVLEAMGRKLHDIEDPDGCLERSDQILQLGKNIILSLSPRAMRIVFYAAMRKASNNQPKELEEAINIALSIHLSLEFCDRDNVFCFVPWAISDLCKIGSFERTSGYINKFISICELYLSTTSPSLLTTSPDLKTLKRDPDFWLSYTCANVLYGMQCIADEYLAYHNQKDAITVLEKISEFGTPLNLRNRIINEGRRIVVHANFSLGYEYERSGNPASALAKYERAIELVELHFSYQNEKTYTINDLEHSSFIHLYLNSLHRSSRMNNPNKETKAELAILVAALSWINVPTTNEKYKINTIVDISETICRNLPKDIFWTSTMASAVRWSKTLLTYPYYHNTVLTVKLDCPNQRQAALAVIEGLVAMTQRETLTLLSHLVSTAQLPLKNASSTKNHWHSFCSAYALKLCQQRNWPSTGLSDPNLLPFAMLLALGESNAQVTRPKPGETAWTPTSIDIEQLIQTANDLRYRKRVAHFNPLWERLFPHAKPAGFLSSILQNPILIPPVLEPTLSSLSENSHDETVRLLKETWHAINDTNNRVDSNGETHVPTLDALRDYLTTWGATDAADAALKAIVYADSHNAIAEQMAQWIKTNLTSARSASGREQQLSQFLKQVAEDFETPQLAPPLLAQLHDYAQAEINAEPEDAERVWHYLEASRVALVTATMKDIAFDTPDDIAAESLREATLGALDNTRRLSRETQEGQPVVTPESADLPIEPFATLGQQMQRLGYRLNLTTSGDAIGLLAPDEQLIQLWWDKSGQGRALWLHKEKGLQSISLPADLAWSSWQALTASWETALKSGIEFASLSPQQKTVTKQRHMLDSIQRAWDAAIHADSPARRLLQWLASSALAGSPSASPRLILLLPASIASLPWFSILYDDKELTPDGSPRIRIELAVSVSAWVKTARQRALDMANPQLKKKHTSGCVVIDSEDPVFQPGTCAFEHAQQVALALGTLPWNWFRTLLSFFGLAERRDIVDATAVGTLRALASPGPVHLLVHGEYDFKDPAQSYLKLSGPFSHLRAWLLGGCQIRGDISTGACTSMQIGTGQGKSEYLGATGIGALLSAAGAQSVIGPLWVADALMATFFYSLWFEERRSKSASEALLETQRKMREMTTEEVRYWVKTNQPMQLSKFEKYIESVTKPKKERGLGWTAPFAHPWCWAGYTLLGESKPLPTLRAPFFTRILRRLQLLSVKLRANVTRLPG